MNTIYGYARCSTDESRQNIDRQIRELKKMGVEDEQHIFFEYGSGKNDKRPEFQKMLSVLEPGDTVCCTEISRLSRSTKMLCEVLQIIQDKKLQLIVGTSFRADCRNEDIDPMTKGMLLMWSVFAELERDMTSERVKSGLKNAAAKGRRIGRPELKTDDIPPKAFKQKALYDAGETTIADVARVLQCSRSTVYRYFALMDEKK